LTNDLGDIIITVSYIRRYKNMVVTKQSIIGEVLDYNVETAQFFLAIGMHCLGCPSARGESIEQACAVHGTDADELVRKINEFLSAQ
jgi:hybrid cluster-associated redox disulfide protein